jgi:hypothetical protein
MSTFQPIDAHITAISALKETIATSRMSAAKKDAARAQLKSLTLAFCAAVR